MALALDCVCAGTGTLTCSVTKLEWVIEEARNHNVSGASALVLKLTGGPSGDVTLPSWAAQVIDLGTPSAWLAVWASLAFEFSGARSLASDDLDTVMARFYLRATYSCTDGTDTSEQEQRAYNLDTASDVCSPDSITIDAAGSIGVGGVAGFIRHTRPLDSCYDFSVTAGNLSPKPQDVQTVDLGASLGHLQLCPSGGSTPYVFGIKSGNLPGGMTLDMTTGVISGSPDGSTPGSPTIVFFVYDGGHDYAEVTCSFLLNCRITQEYGNTMY